VQPTTVINIVPSATIPTIDIATTIPISVTNKHKTEEDLDNKRAVKKQKNYKQAKDFERWVMGSPTSRRALGQYRHFPEKVRPFEIEATNLLQPPIDAIADPVIESQVLFALGSLIATMGLPRRREYIDRAKAMDLTADCVNCGGSSDLLFEK